MHTNTVLKLKPLLRAMDLWGDDVRKRQFHNEVAVNAVEASSTIGITSASGPSEIQDELDDWCAAGGILEFEDEPD